MQDLKEYIKEQVIKRVNTFNYSTVELLTRKTFLMLFFQSVLFDNTYKKSFDFLFNLVLNDSDFKCYKITFTNNRKLMIDNKLEDITFISFKDLINNYFVLNNDYLKRYKHLNFNKKCFVQVNKQYDNTYYYIYVVGKNSIEDIKNIFQLTNYKYKFNFSKSERKLLYKLKNNKLYGFKYSYNLLYFEELQQAIKDIEFKIQDLNDELLYLSDLYLINKTLFKEEQNNYINCLNKKEQLERDLKQLKILESNLLSSKSKKTTIEDYYKKVNLEDKKRKY